MPLTATPMRALPAAPDPGSLGVATPDSALLARITDEVRIDPVGFWLAGDHHEVATRSWAQRAAALTAALTEALHRRYVLRQAGHRSPEVADPEVCARLRRALGERYCWEDGWHARGADASGRQLVERDDLLLAVEADEVRPGRDGLQVRFPADRPESAPGRFGVVGTAGPAPRTAAPAACYLHLAPVTAPEVVAALVAGLDRLGVPFSASVLATPDAPARPDSAVVEVARDRLPVVVAVATGVRRGTPGCFRDAVPAFTREVSPGIAVADVPGPGLDAGRHRCGVIAAALVAAGDDATPTQRHWAVRQALREHRLDAAALHLEPGRRDVDLAAMRAAQ